MHQLLIFKCNFSSSTRKERCCWSI